MPLNVALRVQEPGHAIEQQCPFRAVRDNYDIIKVKEVALNPTDVSLLTLFYHYY